MSSQERQAGATSTKRNSAALSSASEEARSIARASTLRSGWRAAEGKAEASSRPMRWTSGSRSFTATTV